MLILSFFTVSFFGFFALKPTLSTIAKLKRQIEDNREVDKKLSEKINQLVEAQAEYEVISPFIPKIKKALPEKPEYIGALKDLKEIRNTDGATVSSVTIGSVNIESVKPGFLEIGVDAQGGYLPLEELVSKILSNERLMTVLALSISQDNKLEDVDALKMQEEIQAPFVSSSFKGNKK
jgi:Tfp pilus assembly protein PilO